MAPRPTRYGRSTLDGASAHLPLAALEQIVPRNTFMALLLCSAQTCSRRAEPRSLNCLRTKPSTISVIAGPSKGATHQFHKPRISIGHTGGGARLKPGYEAFESEQGATLRLLASRCERLPAATRAGSDGPRKDKDIFANRAPAPGQRLPG